MFTLSLNEIVEKKVEKLFEKRQYISDRGVGIQKIEINRITEQKIFYLANITAAFANGNSTLSSSLR